MKKNSKTLLTIIVSVLVTFFVTSTVFVSKISPFSKFLKVYSLIDSRYIGEYDEEKAQEVAIESLVKSVGDKYTVYYDKDGAEELMHSYEGNYEGIGVSIFANEKTEKIVVAGVFDGSPAQIAGIKGGDCIIAVDNKEYTAKTVDELLAYIREFSQNKKKDKEIEIRVERGADVLNLNVKHDEIRMYSVSSEIIDNVCYIRYGGFSETSHKEVENIIKKLDKSTEGIVIDIRDNPGGSIESVIDLCDMFLDDEMIMYTVDKDGNKKVYRAEKGKCEIPLAVIVNSSSASASEVFAGAIQSNGRGTIVGEKTYGKGVTQAILYVDGKSTDEGILKLTVTKNFTPDGRWINESIIPDIKISEPVADTIENDAAFLAAVKSLKKGNKK